MKFKSDHEKFCAKIERTAQRVYNLRDECPNTERAVWQELDRLAGNLSRLSAFTETPMPSDTEVRG